MTEEWRTVADFVGRYEVSSEGRIRSYLIRGSDALAKEPRILRPRPSARDAYVTIGLKRRDGTYRRASLHRLVLEAFVGPCPPGQEGYHLNRNKSDCRLSNLIWGTHVENESHKIAHGTAPRGENNGLSKLSAHQVHLIRLLRREGIGEAELGRLFGLTKEGVWSITHREVWAHLRDISDLELMANVVEAIESSGSRGSHGDSYDTSTDVGYVCATCHFPWPCPTRRALDAFEAP